MNYNMLFFVLVLVIITSSVVIQDVAYGQRQLQSQIERLTSEGRVGCEIWNIHDFFYMPIRINMSFEKTITIDPKITSGSGEVEGENENVFWEGTKDTFQLVTNTAGTHVVDLTLVYEIQHSNSRNVYYQVFSQDNTLMMEGNWEHVGNTFCKIITFETNEPPHIMTNEDIQEAYNKFNADFRKEVNEYFDSTETGIVVLSILIVIIGIFMVALLFIWLFSLRNISNVANKPAKKLEGMVEVHRNMTKTFQLLIDNLMESSKNFENNSIKRIERALEDLMIVIHRADNVVKIRESFPSPSSMVSPSTPEQGESDNCVIIRKNQPESISNDNVMMPDGLTDEEKDAYEKAENEKIYAKEYGVEIIPSVVDYLPKNDVSDDLKVVDEPDIVTEEVTLDDDTVEKLYKSPISSDNTHHDNEVEVSDDSTCSMCNKKPKQICQVCNQLFCGKKHFNSHECKSNVSPEHDELDVSDNENLSSAVRSTVDSVAVKGKDLIVNAFVESKPESKTSDEYIQKMVDAGESAKNIEQVLSNEYMKMSYEDARKLYDELQENYKIERTFVKALKMNGLLNRLVRSSV